MFGKDTEKKTNPVGLFLERKSDRDNKTGAFKGWNKDLGSEYESKPDQFILLTQTSCIKGWDNESGSGIYSNEVISTKNEEFIIKAFKADKPLYEGIYDKNTIEGLGGTFHKGLIVLENDVLTEYYLKGGALFQWNEDIKNINTNECKVKFDKVEERKKGAIVYYVPRWVAGDRITKEEMQEATSQVEILEDYMKKND